MLKEPFLSAIHIIEKIEQNGYQAYFVGGCVRDLLLDQPIGDIDITTSAKPEVVQDIFDKVIPVGMEHGTVIVRHQKQSYEVTTFRLDGTYSDQRHPDNVEFIDQIEHDLKRRDFTINALAMNKEGTIIDLFHGKDDLKEKLIRTVGNGVDRFQEDPLRIIRALRFSSQLGFSIEQETLIAMKEVKDQIENIATERITKELTKLVSGRYIHNGLNYLKSTKVYKHLPVMVEYPYIIEKVPKQLIPLGSFGELIALFHLLDPTISILKWSREWKCSNHTKNEAIELVEALTYYQDEGLDHWLAYRLKMDFYQGFIRLVNTLFIDRHVTEKDLIHLVSELSITSKKELALNGNDIKNIFPQVREGPWIRKLLHNIEKEVVMGRLNNTTSTLKEWITWNPPEID